MLVAYRTMNFDSQFIVWTNRYSVGSPDIDAQHQKLVELINELNAKICTGVGISIDQLLNTLAVYVAFHFGYEEDLFEKWGYPESAEHKRQHREFVDYFLLIRERYENGGDVNLEALADFLRKWLVGHICCADKKMVEWVEEKSLSQPIPRR